jgi:hypothetical protein
LQNSSAIFNAVASRLRGRSSFPNTDGIKWKLRMRARWKKTYDRAECGRACVSGCVRACVVCVFNAKRHQCAGSKHIKSLAWDPGVVGSLQPINHTIETMPLYMHGGGCCEALGYIYIYIYIYMTLARDGKQCLK